jgi:hypothetical protein
MTNLIGLCTKGHLTMSVYGIETRIKEDDVLFCPPNIKIDNDWYWAYGQKKEQLQNLMDDWGEKQMEREEVLAEYEK